MAGECWSSRRLGMNVQGSVPLQAEARGRWLGGAQQRQPICVDHICLGARQTFVVMPSAQVTHTKPTESGAVVSKCTQLSYGAFSCANRITEHQYCFRSS
mmetsp:Transcript_24583/g.56318  ORF Transcript_24583/g.56318 Transcript_24583/m.56318 type:complete len:100 (+) Transcript_24583:212-511(+)